MKSILNRTFQLAVAPAIALLLTTAAHAQVTLTDIGTNAPTPGANDISQLLNSFPLGGAGNVPGINYYWDNGSNPGQTFTTLGNSAGYQLASVALKTGGNGGGGPTTSQSFTLHIYQVSGTTATLINTFAATSALTAEGDWMQWSGLTNVSLAANSTYAFGFGRSPGSPGDWELISTATNTPQPYAGGQACVIPDGGGTLAFSSSNNLYDMTFDLGLTLPTAPVANAPIENPSYANLGVLAGSNVTLTVSVVGATPLFYQWQTDGGSGGALTNIPGATAAALPVSTAGLAPGAYQYDFVASNSLGTATSPTAAITIVTIFMEDIGTNTPTPGPIDISQLLYTSDNPPDDGINYYTDDGASHGNWAGQTFTTGTNVNGYVMTSLTWKSTDGINTTSDAFNTVQLYDLYIYAITSGGTTANQIASYQGPGGGTDQDWFKWVGLNTPLAPNTVYGYAFGHDATGSGWEHIGDQGGNPYPGGQMFTVTNPIGGTITYGNTGNSDATFDIGLIVAQAPSATVPIYTPNVTPVYADTVITFTEAAVGPPPLHYQWLADNGTGTLSPVGGATGTNLVVNTTGFTPGNFEYAVIVTNTFGSVTSAVVTLNVIAASVPILTVDTTPSNVLAYAQASLAFNAAFVGSLPITDQWQVNTGGGYTNIPNATNTTLGLTNLTAANVGSYTLAASNVVGGASSTPVTLALLPTPPAPAPGSFPALILADNALAYWRLGETNDPSTNYLMTYDATGNAHMGVYGSGVLNPANFSTPGPQSPAFPGFEANNTGIEVANGTLNSQVNIPPLNLNTNSLTICGWINPAGSEGTFWGIFMSRNGADASGLGFGGTVNGSGMAELGYTWNTNSAATYSFNSGLYPPANIWSFVALTITPSNATINLCYVNGTTNVLAAVNTMPHDPEAFGSAGTTWLGGDPTFGATRLFTGFIDEFAVFNHALSQGQIVALFANAIGASAIAPAIATSPASQTLYTGQPATLTVTGGGSTPLTYQWQSGVTNSGVFTNLSDGGAISGSSSSALTVYPLTAATVADYRMILANSAGSATSGVATLNALPIPAGQWVVNFEVTNNLNGSPGLYTLPGVLWNGTAAPRGTWNPILDPLAAFVAGTFSSSSDLQDNGTVHSGISVTISNDGGGDSGGGGGANNPLLSTYILVNTNTPPGTLKFSGVPPGIYNLALYGVDGTYHDRGIVFTVAGMTNTLLNTQDTFFSPGDNTAIFQNVPIVNGTLDVTMAPNPAAHQPNNDEGDFDAAQIQLVELAPVLTTHWNGTTLQLSWPAGSILLQAPDVTGPWTTNNATSPLSVSPTAPRQFYRLQQPY